MNSMNLKALSKEIELIVTKLIIWKKILIVCKNNYIINRLKLKN
jgi:hypothetical protein